MKLDNDNVYGRIGTSAYDYPMDNKDFKIEPTENKVELMLNSMLFVYKLLDDLILYPKNAHILGNLRKYTSAVLDIGYSDKYIQPVWSDNINRRVVMKIDTVILERWDEVMTKTIIPTIAKMTNDGCNVVEIGRILSRIADYHCKQVQHVYVKGQFKKRGCVKTIVDSWHKLPSTAWLNNYLYRLMSQRCEQLAAKTA